MDILEGIKRGNLFSREHSGAEGTMDFENLYRKWAAPVYRYLCARLQNPHDAEDLTSQVFLSAYQGLEKYQDRENFAGWIFTIARNRLVDWRRRQHGEFSLAEVDEPVQETDFLGGLARKEEKTRLRTLIANLSDEEKEIIHLRYVADLGFAEIAQVLQRSEGAVKKSLYRLQEKLFKQMEGSHD